MWSVFQQILAWLRGAFAYLFQILQGVFMWMWDAVAHYVDPYIIWLKGKYDEFAAQLNFPDMSTLADYWAGANLWVPLDEFVTLSGYFFALQVVVIAVRFFFKLVPGMG